MKLRFASLSLRQRLLVLMLAASAAAACVVALAIIVYEQTAFRPRAVASLHQQVNSLSEVITPPLLFNDAVTATSYLQTLRDNTDIGAIALFSTDGEIFASYARDKRYPWPSLVRDDREEFIGDQLRMWHVVSDGRMPIGYLFVSSRIPPLFARLPQYGIMAGAVVLALIAVSLVLLGGLNTLFVNPLRELTTTADQVNQQKDYSLRAKALRDDELGRLAHTFNDMLGTIEERDRALRRSERRLRSIIDNEPECVKLISRSGELLEINPAGLRLLEVKDLDEARSKPLLEFVAAEHREGFREMFRRVVAGTQDGVEFVLEGLHGSRTWLETRAVQLIDERGEVTVLAISRDISARKRFEESMAARNEQQASIIKLGIDALSIQDFDALLQRVVKELQRVVRADFALILELMPGSKVGKVRAAQGWDKWKADREWRIEPDTPTALVLNQDAPVHVRDFRSDMRFSEAVRNHRFGFRSSIAVRIRTSATPWGIVAVHSSQANAFTDHDINVAQEVANLLAQAIQRVNAEGAQRLVEAQLLQSQKMDALGTLAGGIAHDFNNLLSAILGNVQLAKQDIGTQHPARISLDEIQRAGQRSKELVQRILTFSRYQEPRKESVRLQAIVEEAVRLLRATIPAQIVMIADVDASVPATMADAVQVHQCILNLATNAWQAIGRNSGRIAVTLRSESVSHVELGSMLKPGEYARIDVTDTGIGMSAATRAHIFEPFFTTKPLGEGTGLGLSMVHGIMQSHGGAIEVHSEVGQGSTFSLYFPLVSSVEYAEAPTTTEQLSTTKDGSAEILYIDDEEPLVFLASRLLERMGYQVAGFCRARDALQAFRDNPDRFDLIVTDLSMPEMSGMDLAREVLSVRPTARVILASGYIRQADVDAAKKIGIREVLLKPNTVDELGPIVRRLLSETQ